MAPKANKPAVEEEGTISLDFSGVKPFEPLDDKEIYSLRVTKMEPGKAKSGNHSDVVNVEFTILGPEEVKAMAWTINDDGIAAMTGGYMVDKDGAPVLTRAKDRKIFRTYSLETKALPFLHEFIKAADPKAVLDENFKFKPKTYEGLDVAAKVQNEGYNEQIRARAQRILPASAYKG